MLWCQVCRASHVTQANSCHKSYNTCDVYGSHSPINLQLSQPRPEYSEKPEKSDKIGVTQNSKSAALIFIAIAFRKKDPLLFTYEIRLQLPWQHFVAKGARETFITISQQSRNYSQASMSEIQYLTLKDISGCTLRHGVIL